MGTRSAVAVPYEGSWRGRYVHWDGYPSHAARHLWAIVKRDGLEKAREILTQDHYGWSSISSVQPDIEGVVVDQDKHYYDYDHGSVEYVAGMFAPNGPDGDGRFANVVGYGVAYTTHDGQSSPSDWISSPGVDWDIEWYYVLGDDGLTVGVAGEASFATYPWENQEPDWSEVEVQAEEVSV